MNTLWDLLVFAMMNVTYANGIICHVRIRHCPYNWLSDRTLQNYCDMNGTFVRGIMRISHCTYCWSSGCILLRTLQ